GYVFEQPHTKTDDGLTFTIPDQTRPLQEYIVPIDDIEKRTGLDFFPLLKDSLENALETADPDSMWSD
ncbi:MAG: hypothetical protein IH945_05985, partial [Armatimonadetes bacterium]|nr:hypothetical protein [Armatimonadota bacterium]